MSAPAAFVSYSREDSEFVLRLARDLKAAGANVWLDQLDIQPGHAWDSMIESALIAATRTRPPVARRFSWSTMSGAAMTRLAVKAAAALAGVSATMRAKSVRPLFLRPALAAPNLKPWGSRFWDASDIEVDPFNLTGELRHAWTNWGRANFWNCAR